MMSEALKGKEIIGQAIGRIASGVYILTAEDGNTKAGMLASWVMQTGFEPPTISAALHPDREVYQIIEKTGRFTLNVISKENHGLMKAFSKYSPEQFEQVTSTSTYCGIQLKDAIASLDCVVKQQVHVTDHVLLVAEVVSSTMLQTNLEPMTHLRKSGFTY